MAGTAGYVTSGLILSPADPAAGQATVLGTGLAVTVYAAALWWVRRAALQNAALFIGLIILSCGVLATAGRGNAVGTSPLAYSLVLWGLGLGWAALGWRRRAEPVWVSFPLGTLLALTTPGIAAGEYGWMYATGILTAAAAMAASVPLRNAVLLAIGTIAMFGYVTSAAVTCLLASLGVPATLSVTGLVIIGLAVATARLMRATRGPGSRQPHP